MVTSKSISEFEAAIEIKMSPTLLRWFTVYSPKKDGRILKFTEISGIYFYDRNEIYEFSKFLHLPWKKPVRGHRPRIPSGIELEIKTESHYRCPICNTNSGEIAHIKAVATSYDNHPHNLIFLCPTHHTVYDYGHIFNNIKEEDVILHKKALLHFQTICWAVQGEIVSNYLGLINMIGRAKEIAKILLNENSQPDFDTLFRSIYQKIDLVKPTKRQSQKVEELVTSVREDKTNDSIQMGDSLIAIRNEIQKEYSENEELSECPLCLKKGYTTYYDICPVCAGEGYINIDDVVEISAYELEECPLCEGKCRTDDYDICPACEGKGSLPSGVIDDMDVSAYELEECPLCEGKCRTDDYDICPACEGKGSLPSGVIDDMDVSAYELEECPLCEGKCRTDDYDICPACEGKGSLPSGVIDDMDVSAYELEECPLCEGKCRTDDYDICPACEGKGSLPSGVIDDMDVSAYELEECPLCEGKCRTDDYDICPACEGKGSLSRGVIEDMDFNQF